MSASQVKRMLVHAMDRGGVFSLVRRCTRARTRAPLYHRFSETVQDGCVSRALFTEHVRYARDTFGVLDPATLPNDLADDRHGVVITVDDGYRDFYDIAYPVLRAAGVPAIIFLTTDFVDGKGWLWFDRVDFLMRNCGTRRFRFPLLDADRDFGWEDGAAILARLKQVDTPERDAHVDELAKTMGISIPELPTDDYQPLNWDQVREMSAHGIRFGAHTCSHPILTCTDADMAQYEIEQSKARIEAETGAAVSGFAYPNGNYNDLVRGLVKYAGYRFAFSCNYGFIESPDDPFTLGRMPVGERPMIYYRQELSGVDLVKKRIRELPGGR